MVKELFEKEYSSLRDEIVKWQDRRIVISQIALTLVLAYTGYMIKDGNKKGLQLSWQVVSVFPLLILTITMHMNILFEKFQLRAAEFLAVYYQSTWEIEIRKFSLSKGKLNIGYNKSWAIIYLLIAFTSIYVLYLSFPGSLYNWQTAIFGFFCLLFLFKCLELLMFGTNDERWKFYLKWQKIKNKQDV